MINTKDEALLINSDTCDVCFKIVCRKCKWEPDDKEVSLIQSGKLTACPDCGWKPKESTV